MIDERDVLKGELSHADDRVHLDPGGSSQVGVAPHLRIGKWWFNTLWLIPLGAVLLVAGIAISQKLRSYPAVEQFIAHYPGTPASAPVVRSGFPVWLRWQHFLNLFFLMFIIRAGIQILASHPRLYWGAIRRRIPSGSAFSMRFRRTESGRPRMTRWRSPVSWGFRVLGLRSDWQDGGTFPSTCSGSSTERFSTCSCSRPISGSV